MIFALFRIPVDFIKQVWISQECPQAGISTEIDSPAMILDVWIIGRISVAEFAPTECNKTVALLLRGKDS
jgi:hypothetical protein